MFGRLFPTEIDNTYRGHWLGFWLLVPVVLAKFLMGFNVSGLDPLISPREVAESADGLPLASFGEQAASVALFLFSSWGLALLVLSLFGVVILIRYRGMIPLLYLAVLIEQAGRRAIQIVHPVVRSGAHAAIGGFSFSVVVNGAFLALLVTGFVLSLLDGSRGTTRVSREAAR